MQVKTCTRCDDERASETREAHATEVAEIRNEPEKPFERVIVIVGHGARRVARQPSCGPAFFSVLEYLFDTYVDIGVRDQRAIPNMPHLWWTQVPQRLRYSLRYRQTPDRVQGLSSCPPARTRRPCPQEDALVRGHDRAPAMSQLRRPQTMDRFPPTRSPLAPPSDVVQSVLLGIQGRAPPQESRSRDGADPPE